MKNFALCIFMVTAAFTLHSQTVIPLEIDTNLDRIGISVQLGSNTNWFTYILDTGSPGFFSAMGTNSNWSGAFNSFDTNKTYSATYETPGSGYSGYLANTDITFKTINGTLTVTNAEMGVVTNKGSTWNNDINQPTPTPPLEGKYYGTMGAGFSSVAITDVTSGRMDGTLTSLLGQIKLVPGLIQGYMISTGGPGSTNGTLTIGLTQAMINSFSTLIDMQASTGNHTNANQTVANLYPVAQATATYSIVDSNGIPYTTNANLTLDTGGYDTHLIQGTDMNVPTNLLTSSNNYLASGESFNVSRSASSNAIITNNPTPLSWTIDPTGTNAFANQVGYSPSIGGNGGLNTGITFFYQYNVLFDTQDGIIGVAAVPEPSSLMLLSISVLFMLIYARSRVS